MKTHNDLTREERISKVMEQRKSDFCLILENLSEDQNISAILRTAEAFGVGLVCIIYSDKKPKLSKGVSSGASKWLNIEYFKSVTACVKRVKGEGYRVIGALVDPEAEVLWEEDFMGKVAILVGNEAKGMTPKAQKLVDKNIYLPMLGLTESLNVSVSAAVFLYEVLRQKEIKENISFDQNETIY
jgi:tRNA (guanosine-2'-O-)-methyltransferase